jgi:hypothetical protein
MEGPMSKKTKKKPPKRVNNKGNIKFLNSLLAQEAYQIRKRKEAYWLVGISFPRMMMFSLLTSNLGKTKAGCRIAGPKLCCFLNAESSSQPL